MPEHDPSTPGFHCHRSPVLVVKFALGRLRAVLRGQAWPSRGTFLNLFPKNSTGVELGVFCGEFTQQILDYVKPEGIIAGHDWHPDPTHWHHGVYRAVNDFMKAKPSYEVIHTDAWKNWCLRQEAA